MASLPELQDALVNAHKAGDVDAARRLADAIVSATSKPAAVGLGEQLRSNIEGLPRQLGLTARYALEGPAQTAEIVTEPIRRLVTDPLTRLIRSGATSKPLGAVASHAADWLGLPKPEGANERVIGDGARLVAGAGGLVRTATTAAKAAPGLLQQAGTFLSANPGSQLLSAAGAGAFSGAAREAGADPLVQGAAGLAGGLVAPAGGAAARYVADKGRNVLNRLTPAQMQQRIDVILERQGVDLTAIPENARAVLRQQLQDALQAGKELDPGSVRRLLDFAMVRGATPTRGMVSLDPVQITRERNLAKLAANSDDPLMHVLPRMEDANNKALLRAVDDIGPAVRPDGVAAGERVIGAIGARDARAKGIENRLYRRAQDSAGRDVQLSRGQFVNRAFELLAKENKTAFLPESVGQMLDTISKGQVVRNGQAFDVPFDVDAMDQLKTTLAAAHRGTQDGNAKRALTLIRQALDETPIEPIKRDFGSSQMVTGQAAQAVQGADAAPETALKAFDKARKFARDRRGWQESSKTIEAALDGQAPDQFVQRFVLGKMVPVADVEKAAAVISKNSDAREAVRGFIVEHLKKQATGGAPDEIASFSPSAYRKALDGIGERKLKLFFDAQELEQLQAVGRVAGYMGAQPKGSAVNNSNSGALVLGKGLDWLQNGARFLPFGESAVSAPINNIRLQIGQGHAAQGPLAAVLAPPKMPLGQRLLPSGLYSALLAAQPVDER